MFLENRIQISTNYVGASVSTQGMYFLCKLIFMYSKTHLDQFCEQLAEGFRLPVV